MFCPFNMERSIGNLILIWDTSKFDSLIDDAIKAIMPYFSNTLTEKTIKNALSVVVNLTKKSISAVVKVASAFFKILSDLEIFNTLKQWFSSFIELLTNLASKMVKYLKPLVPYIYKIVTLFQINKDLTAERALDVATDILSKHGVTLDTVTLELSRRTHLLTDTFCFYVCFEEIRTKYLPFSHEVIRVISEWFRFAKYIYDRRYHGYTSALQKQYADSLLSLVEDIPYREQLSVLLNENVIHFYDLAAQCVSEYALRSPKNLKSVFMRLYSISHQNLLKHYNATDFLSEIEFRSDIKPLSFYTMGDLLETPEFKHLPTKEGPMISSVIKAGFEFEISCVERGVGRKITPISTNATLNRMFDPRHGRINVTDALAVTEIYCTVLNTMNTSQIIFNNIFEWSSTSTDNTNYYKAPSHVFVGAKKKQLVAFKKIDPDEKIANMDLYDYVEISPHYDTEAIAEESIVFDCKTIAYRMFLHLEHNLYKSDDKTSDFRQQLNYAMDLINGSNINALEAYRENLVEYIEKISKKMPTLMVSILDVSRSGTAAATNTTNLLKRSIIVRQHVDTVKYYLAENILSDAMTLLKYDTFLFSSITYRELIRMIHEWIVGRAESFAFTTEYVRNLVFKRAVLEARIKMHTLTNSQYVWMWAGLAAGTALIYYTYAPIENMTYWWNVPGPIAQTKSVIFGKISDAWNYVTGTSTTQIVDTIQSTNILHEFVKWTLYTPSLSPVAIYSLFTSTGFISILNSLVVNIARYFFVKFGPSGKTQDQEFVFRYINTLFSNSDPEFLKALNLEMFDNDSWESSFKRFFAVAKASLGWLLVASAGVWGASMVDTAIKYGTDIFKLLSLFSILGSVGTLAIGFFLFGTLAFAAPALMGFAKMLSSAARTVYDAIPDRTKIRQDVSSIYTLGKNSLEKINASLFNTFSGTSESQIEEYKKLFHEIRDSIIDFSENEKNLSLDPHDKNIDPKVWYLYIKIADLQDIEHLFYQNSNFLQMRTRQIDTMYQEKFEPMGMQEHSASIIMKLFQIKHTLLTIGKNIDNELASSSEPHTVTYVTSPPRSSKTLTYKSPTPTKSSSSIRSEKDLPRSLQGFTMY